MVEIDFSCKEIPVRKVLQCSLGLRYKELEVLRGLEDAMNAEDIADKFEISKNYAQRIVKTLTEKGLVDRRSYNLRAGGYVYEYQRKPQRDIIRVVLDTLEAWHSRAKKTVREEGL